MADALPRGQCQSLSGDSSFSITIRVYYSYKVTTTITKTQTPCCGNPAPEPEVNRIISTNSAPDFSHSLFFRYSYLDNQYHPNDDALIEYQNKWNAFQIRLEEGRAALVEQEKVTSTVTSPPIVCAPAHCEDGVRIPTITCKIVTTTKRKKEAESIVVNSTITSPDAICNFT